MVRRFLWLERMNQGSSLELTRRVGSGQLHMCIGCVMMKLEGVRTELIRWYV